MEIPEAISLDLAEEQLEQHERDMQAQVLRSQRVEPVLDEARDAQRRIENGLVEEICATPPWRFWEIASYVLALKASRRYGEHFQEVVGLERASAEEIQRIHSDPRWARIEKWRRQ